MSLLTGPILFRGFEPNNTTTQVPSRIAFAVSEEGTLYHYKPTLTLTLIQPASKWMHWDVTLRRHSDLFRAATSAPILNKSLLTVLLPSVGSRTIWTFLNPWNLPVQRLSRYELVVHSYHMSKPAESSFSEYMSSGKP